MAPARPGSTDHPGPPQAVRPLPDGAWIHTELRKPGVTLQLLHLEYIEQHPAGYRYAQFCEYYHRWLSRQGVVLRQIHRCGEKVFVDYSGKRPSIIDPHTGEVRPVELFTAVLGASNYTYVEATLTQQVPDWIASHTRAFAFFGGFPGAVVCDQLKSGVAPLWFLRERGPGFLSEKGPTFRGIKPLTL
jgi:transposase